MWIHLFVTLYLLRGAHPRKPVKVAPSAPLNYYHECSSKLGLENKLIPGASITASGSVAPQSEWGAHNARLNWSSAWVTLAKPNQWLQIDFGKVVQVSGIMTQGALYSRGIWDQEESFWVTKFRVMYKMRPDDPEWQPLKSEFGNDIIFEGNTEATQPRVNMFRHLTKAKLVQIVPWKWPSGKNKIAMRVELLGCNIVNQEKSGCGGLKTLTNHVGYFWSNNYPKAYKNNAICDWEIQAPPGKAILLTFDSLFAIEEVSECLMEHVEVIDVIDGTEKSLGAFCGNTSPGTFSSTGNKLKINFRTDHFVGEAGFRAKYVFINGSRCGGPQTLKENEGVLHSMNYPEEYVNMAQCAWDIQVPEGMLIEFQFDQIELATTHTICDEDFITLSEYGDEEIISSQTFCHERDSDEVYLSKTRRLRVDFVSNDEETETGFKAHYHAITSSKCGGPQDLTRTAGNFSTLNYPNNYPLNLQCEWNITSGKGKLIKLYFDEFHIEDGNECEYDYVHVYDGTVLLGAYCGEHAFNDPFVVHNGNMHVMFYSDQHNTYSGFAAHYVIEAIPVLNTTTESTATAKTTQTKIQTSTSTIFKALPKITAISTTSLQSSTKHETFTPIQTFSEFPVNKVKVDKPHNPNKPLTEEMAKWIIVGLASVSGLLIVLVLFGIILCCRQNLSNAFGVQSSIKNTTTNNSSAMHNHAYDFSIGSTNHSIRSKQIEPVESSQVLDSGTSRPVEEAIQRRISCDSHIYFSIEECYGNKKKESNPTNSAVKQTPNVKVHFTAQQKNSTGSSSYNANSSGSNGAIFEGTTTEDCLTLSEEYLADDYFYDDDELSNSLHGSGLNFSERGTTAKISSLERRKMSAPQLLHNTNEIHNKKHLLKTNSSSIIYISDKEKYEEGEKVLVNNVLYSSAGEEGS